MSNTDKEAMRTSECQHCGGTVVYGVTELGFKGFVHVDTGKATCEDAPCCGCRS